jgi:hypothetical protein
MFAVDVDESLEPVTTKEIERLVNRYADVVGCAGYNRPKV